MKSWQGDEKFANQIFCQQKFLPAEFLPISYLILEKCLKRAYMIK